ncbi:cation diffusion facilitator family transporter [Desulfitobacterium sp.]|uniref:cation diffusion facilitator family transporter n=1 Tax=Desulfitobacterium sp. TaxID=49981 RepID=UPI002BCAA711|nr:cation diffusion facilitator family transporter [Desulfitobacterium sp.]HVJ49675.1 cation diffusion facilitator family transporter [Desulfitobacterium sp.]
MIKFIIRSFIQDYEAIHNKQVREAYGVLGGVLGVICNLLLFIIKLTIGSLIHSIAVISDAFNNLSDLGSSLISIISAKMSNLPPDPEHPFGHGRIEYIASLIVSFIIFSVGFQLLKSSFSKILAPEKVIFSPILMLILFLSVLVKVWMFFYNKYIGETINSSINKATAYDSLNDVIATSAVIATTILEHFIPFSIDGIVGLAISFLILYTGFKIAKGTVNLLMGLSPNPELVHTINSKVREGQYIVGTHDLKIHDYGPGRIIASIHAEVLDTINIVEAHAIIDDLEKRISDELGINIVIHIDPISTDIEKNEQIKVFITNRVYEINEQFSVKNLRTTKGLNCTNTIFDLFVPSSIKKTDYKEICKLVSERIVQNSPQLNIIIDTVNPIISEAER